MTPPQAIPTDTRDQAEQIRVAWNNIGVVSSYGEVELTDFEARITAVDEAARLLARLEDQLAAARETYKEKRQHLWQGVKHVRTGARIKHGEDSLEYERFGGTRTSDYKKRQPAAKPSKPEPGDEQAS